MAYGSALHHAVAGYSLAKQKGLTADLPLLASLFTQAWEGQRSVRLMAGEAYGIGLAREDLSCFLERESESDHLSGAVPVLIEHGFRVHLDLPRSSNTITTDTKETPKQVPLVGVYDRIDGSPRLEDGAKLIEYKT